jgi:hypothetical protein
MNPQKVEITKMFAPVTKFLQGKRIKCIEADEQTCVDPKEVFYMAKHMLPEISKKLYTRFLDMKKRRKIKIVNGLGSEADVHNYHMWLDILQSTSADAFASLCHELTHFESPWEHDKDICCEVVPRTTDGIVDRYLASQRIRTSRYHRFVLNDIDADREHINLVVDKIEGKRAGEARSDMLFCFPYYYGSVGSLPLVRRIADKKISLEDTFGITERNFAERMAEMKIGPHDILASTKDFIKV